jgi:hypothetical protein
MKQKRVLVVSLIAAVVAVMAAPMIAEPGYGSTTYRLRVNNNSNAFEHFFVEQIDSDLGLGQLHGVHP